MKSQNSQSIGVSTFASRTSPSTDQSLQKSFHLFHPDKIELKKISSPSEKKNTRLHNATRQRQRNLMQTMVFKDGQTEHQPVTAGLRNWRFSG
jgi:hypothetical protein